MGNLTVNISAKLWYLLCWDSTHSSSHDILSSQLLPTLSGPILLLRYLLAFGKILKVIDFLWTVAVPNR